MTELDFVLLTVYFLCVTYVLYQIVSSFNNEFMIWLDQDDLDGQLATLNLKDTVGISFKFDSRYEFDKLKKLSIRVANKSNDHALYIDWDHCALTDQYEPPRSRRVTRSVPGSPTDVFQRQVFSVVAPGKNLVEDLFAEDMLTRKDAGSVAVQASETVLDFTEPNRKAPEAKRRRYRRFMSGEEMFKFDLYLILRFVGSGTSPTGDRVPIVCRFNIRKLDWTAGLPWNPKLP